MRLITLHLPEPYIKALDRLVDEKYYPNRAEAIRVAVRDFLNVEVWDKGRAQKKKPHIPKKEPPCPSCGNQGPHETAVKSLKRKGLSFVDVGWHCRKCGHEWGFELWKTEQA